MVDSRLPERVERFARSNRDFPKYANTILEMLESGKLLRAQGGMEADLMIALREARKGPISHFDPKPIGNASPWETTIWRIAALYETEANNAHR